MGWKRIIYLLKKYIEDIISGKKEMQASYDLWEMNEGIHLYSISSIYAAFISILNLKNLACFFLHTRLYIQI